MVARWSRPQELIRTYPDEYDATIPDTISLAQFVLQHTDQFGQNIASVSPVLFLFYALVSRRLLLTPETRLPLNMAAAD